MKKHDTESNDECMARLLARYPLGVPVGEHRIVPEDERPVQSPALAFTGILREPFTPSSEPWRGGEYYTTRQPRRWEAPRRD